MSLSWVLLFLPGLCYNLSPGAQSLSVAEGQPPSRVWKIEVPLEEGQGRGRELQGPGPPGRTPRPEPPRLCPHERRQSRSDVAGSAGGREARPGGAGSMGGGESGVGGMAGVALPAPAAAARAAGAARGGRGRGLALQRLPEPSALGPRCSLAEKPAMPHLPRRPCSGTRGHSASACSFPSGSSLRQTCPNAITDAPPATCSASFSFLFPSPPSRTSSSAAVSG